MNEVRRRRRNASQWSKLLDQWTKSGKSAERFAARVGVKPSTLAKWQKSEASKGPPAAASVVRAKKKERAASLFARVQVMERPTRADGLVEVVMRDGIMLRLHGSVDADTLGAVLGALSRC